MTVLQPVLHVHPAVPGHPETTYQGSGDRGDPHHAPQRREHQQEAAYLPGCRRPHHETQQKEHARGTAQQTGIQPDA
jgi:hypothetical protein